MYPVQKCPPQRYSGQKCLQKHPPQNRPPQNRPPQKCPPQKYLPQNILLRKSSSEISSSEISSSEISSSDMPIKTFQFLEEDFQLLEIMLYFFVMAIPKVVKYIPNTGSSLPRSPSFHTKTGSSFRLLRTGSQILESMLAMLFSTLILKL